MAELPILFSGPLVRAILSGAKTQTRRLVKPQPAPNSPYDGGTSWVFRPKEGVHIPVGTVGHLTVAEKMGLRCPYGVPGDRLWVRETWGQATSTDGFGCVAYAAGGPARVMLCEDHGEGDPYALAGEATGLIAPPAKWRPSIHMPRWASRITLEVTDVRVERLQAITEEDARAEGLSEWSKDGRLTKYGMADRDGLPGTDNTGWPWDQWDKDPRVAFARLWDRVYAAAPWHQDPWVWVVSFKPVEVRHG
jgi:hypothetical protein